MRMTLQRFPLLHRLSFVSAILLMIFAMTPQGQAQQSTAQLNGRILDGRGAAVVDAKVTVSDASRGFSVSVTTDASGDYVVPLLQPADHYRITVDRAGFQQTVRKDVSLQVAQTAKIDLTLQVGEVTQSVTVTGAPPLLDTQTSSIGQVITGQTVQDLPLNGRSTFRLIALTPGVVFNQSAYGQFGDVPVNSTFDTNFSINGGRAQSNEILIDGVPSSAGFFDQITTIPDVDDTQEFKVESNNLSAQYGRYAGGVVNVSTKSGANTVHGTAFEFIRNSAFEANQWFLNHAGKPIPAFKLNQFGGTVGGPLVLPKIYNGRNRTFFFLDYQGTRRIQGTPYTALVPTDLQKQGVFGSVNIYNPFTTVAAGAAENRQQFSYMGVLNTIPTSMIDPVAAAIQKYFPEPNLSGVTGKNFSSSAPSRVNQDVFSARIDQNVTQKYHLFGRYAYSNSGLTQPNAFGNIADAEGAVGTTIFRNQSFAFDNIYSITPSLLLSVDYGYARWFQSRKTLSYGFDITTLGLPASLANEVSIKMFPSISIGGGFVGTNNQSYLSNGNDSHALLASLTKLAGKHTIVAGVDGRLHRINFFNVGSSTGSYSFAIAQTQGPNAVVATGGNAYASFLIGAGNSGTIPLGSGVEMQDLYGALYVEDNWRLSERLTLNLGLRYDGESPYVDRHNELNYFSPTVPSPAVNASFPNLTGGLQFAAANGHPRNVYTRQHLNVAPRVGFSFSPNNSTVVRGGFGLAYAPLEISNNAVGFSPSLGYGSSTAWNTSNNGGYNPANLLSNPYPQGLIKPSGSSLGAGTQLGQALSVWYNNPPTPTTYQWNLDVQQQLPGDILFDVGYVGSRGLYLTGSINENTLNPTYLSMGSALTKQVSNPFQPFVTIGSLSNPTVAQQQLLLPYPQFLGITVENDPYGSSTYHSLQLKVVKRVAHGLTMLASYTWSKQMSNVNASDSPIGTSNSTSVQNAYNVAAERSESELNIPQSFVMNTTYELPFGRGKRFGGNAGTAVNKFIGGWKLNGIWTEQTGQPLMLTAAITGIASGRPNLTGISPIIQGKRPNTQRVSAWFNTAAFATPPAYTFGNARRTFTGVRGPGLQNLDSSLIKDSQFEKVNVELRAEFFNVTNTPHFSLPDTGVQDASFGAISGTVISPPQRELQFGLKISF
jgi:hypothetical protein